MIVYDWWEIFLEPGVIGVGIAIKERERLMGQISVKAEAVLEAPSEKIYATIADYRQGHPNMLPKELYDLQVEQRGYRAGTIHRFKMLALGVAQSYYQPASEP